jgi:hypothetical protein
MNALMVWYGGSLPSPAKYCQVLPSTATANLNAQTPSPPCLGLPFSLAIGHWPLITAGLWVVAESLTGVPHSSLRRYCT